MALSFDVSATLAAQQARRANSSRATTGSPSRENSPGLDDSDERLLLNPASSQAASSQRGSSPAGGDGTTEATSSPEPSHDNASRKRPAEELLIAAQRASQRMKLKDSGERSLIKFTSLGRAERDILMMAAIIKTNERIDEIQPSDAIWNLPGKLYAKIELYSADVLLCPHLAVYWGREPVNLLLDILSRHPSWGFTQDVRDDDHKLDVVCNRVQARLTERRNLIKGVMLSSLGKPQSTDSERRVGATHIFDLVTAVVKKVHKSVKSNAQSVKVTVAMCARFALLRKILQQDSSTDYWKTVDASLLDIRTQLRRHSKEAASLYFKDILDQDLLIYGQVDLDNVSVTRITPVQDEINHFATGNTADLDEVESDGDA